MPPTLLDLQPELQFIIANALGPDYTGLGDNDVRKKYDDDGMSAPTRDAERRDREKQSRRTLINWSCTSKFFRALLAPHIFNSIVLRNDEKNAASVKAIEQHPEYSNHVQELLFIGYAPGDARREDPAFSDVGGILPGIVADVLGDLRVFLNLKTLAVEFDFNFEEYEEWEEEGVDLTSEPETEEEMERNEGEEAWRALMVKVWEAISRNEGGVIRKLAINNLYYKRVSTFNTTPFHSFLNHIEEFTLSIYGGDNGAGWNTNTCEIWSHFVGKLDIFFFNHLSSVTSLTLKATENAPLGLEGRNHAPLVLRKEHMPLLKTVHLEWVFIGPELRDFLVGHADTLEELHLRNGLAETNTGMSDDGIHWWELFDAISSAKPPKLRTFKVTEDRPAPLPNDMGDFDEGFENADKEVVKAEIEVAKGNAERGEGRVWAHVIVDDKYGMLFEDEEHNFLSMRDGKDQDAWVRLMDLVKASGGDGELAGWGANLARWEEYGREYTPCASPVQRF